MTTVISKEIGENFRNFSELLMTRNINKELYIAHFNKYTDSIKRKEEEEVALEELYRTQIHEPRMNIKQEYTNYLEEREVIFQEYMRTKKKSVLQKLLLLKNPLENEVISDIYTKYGNPKII